MCDNCKNEESSTRTLEKVGEIAKAIGKILNQAEGLDTKLTALKLVNATLGRGEGKLKVKLRLTN